MFFLVNGFARLVVLWVTLSAMLFVNQIGVVQVAAREFSVIRDSELEDLLGDYLRPLARAAGLPVRRKRIVILNDSSLNAFVAGDNRIFVNTGLFLKTRTPNEAIGILAHELGHVAGQHLAKLRTQLASMQTAQIIELLLNSAALIAGAASGSITTLSPSPGAGLVGRTLLGYQRNQEFSADKSALRYLNATKQSPRGLVAVFNRMFASQIGRTRSIDPYLQTHPLAKKRLSRLVELAKKSRYFNKKDSKALIFRHTMAKAKIVGFTQSSAIVTRIYPRTDRSLPARYARAINGVVRGNKRKAIAEVEALIKVNPKNPYFWELKGQALLENARPKEAIAAYKRAVNLKPNNGQLKVLYGHALVASNNSKLLNEAIKQLKRGLQLDDEAIIGYRQLASAYARKGLIGKAQLATAEFYYHVGDYAQARFQAKRAKKSLRKGSPSWLRADDIVSFQR